LITNPDGSYKSGWNTFLSGLQSLITAPTPSPTPQPTPQPTPPPTPQPTPPPSVATRIELFSLALFLLIIYLL